MNHYFLIIYLTFIFNASIAKANDYVWGEEFKEGDIISAAIFNQIFSTLEKVNRTPVDADLVGTWSCDAVHSQTGLDTTGWTVNDFLLVLNSSQLTMTASSQSTSLSQSYSFSTSNPSPFIRLGTNAASSGTYILFNGMLLMKGIMSASAVSKFKVDIVSDDRFILTPMSDGGNYPDLIMCDSAIAVPAAPVSTTASNNQTSVNITWVDQSSDETGFKVYRRLSSETEATELATAINASPYVDSSLTEGQTAYYSVSAYNSNGESKKSRVASVTLDATGPSVISHTPLSNQTGISRSEYTVLSITFSEPIVVVCPSNPNATNSCLDTPIAVTQLGSSGKTYAGLNLFPKTGTSFSGSTTGHPSNYEPNDVVTVTVNSEWIKDANGVPMEADYSFTYTVAP